MRIGLVLGGDPPSPADMKLLDACQEVVACDAGAHALLQAERPPTIIVGDLDSLDPEAYKWADALDIPIQRHPEKKDQTDGELALDVVLGKQPNGVIILGGHGGRTAMFLANLRLLRRCHEAGLEALMHGQGESIRFVSAGGELNLTGRTGSTLNVLPMDGDAVISLIGTEWEVDHEKLAYGSSRGVSNEIMEDGATIRVHQGLVLVVTEAPLD
ncbi:MAG: thiamine diphosphokinase [Thermoplasmatota archaeon]